MKTTQPLIIKIQPLHPNLMIPQKASQQASAFDIHACIQNNLAIQPNQRMLIPTGFALEIPIGFEAEIRPRSGLALHHGITLLNSPATIDSDYRGEIQILLINLGSQTFTIQAQERIAQMLFKAIQPIQFQLALELKPSKRNQDGFGSTGRLMNSKTTDQ